MAGRCQRFARHLELRPARHAAIEPDHWAPARVSSRYDFRGLAFDDQLGSHLEALGCLACVFDDEGTIETMGLTDTSDDDGLRRAHRQRLD